MKWGVRRYQNPDGSLTAAGKARYGTGESESASKYEKVKSAAKSMLSANKDITTSTKKIQSSNYNLTTGNKKSSSSFENTAVIKNIRSTQKESHKNSTVFTPENYSSEDKIRSKDLTYNVANVISYIKSLKSTMNGTEEQVSVGKRFVELMKNNL